RFTKEIPLPAGEEFRRSVYVQVRRSRPLSVLEAFDVPLVEPNCEARSASTVTPQALMLMNGEFLVKQAEFFALRLREEAGDDPPAQVVRAWRLAFAREPSEKEIQEALHFLTEQAEYFRANLPQDLQPPPGGAAAGKPDPQYQALASFCQALLSANPFLY